MTDRTLAGADPEPAQLVGYGPLPAPVARDLVRADEKAQVWVRRVYTDPTTGDLAGTDARRRDFPMAARMFLTARGPDLPHPLLRSPDPASRPHRRGQVEALPHHLPDPQQALANLGFAAQDQFVLLRDPADRPPGGPGVCQQFRASSKRVGHIGAVGNDCPLAGLVRRG